MTSGLELQLLLFFVLAGVGLLLSVYIFMAVFAMPAVCIVVAIAHFLTLTHALIAIYFDFARIFYFINDVLLRFGLFRLSQ